MKLVKTPVVRQVLTMLAVALIQLSCSLNLFEGPFGLEKNQDTPVQPTVAPTQIPAQTELDFPAGGVEQDAFIFDYAAGWQPYFEGELPGMVDVQLEVETLGAVVETNQYVETPIHPFYFNAAVVMRKAIPAGSSLEEIYRATYAEQVLAYPDEAKDGTSQLGGLPALERTYLFFSGEPRYDIRELWVERDGWAYILSLRAQYTTQVNLDRPGFKTIEDSFQFKD